MNMSGNMQVVLNSIDLIGDTSILFKDSPYVFIEYLAFLGIYEYVVSVFS